MKQALGQKQNSAKSHSVQRSVWESHVHTRARRNAYYKSKPLSKSLTICLGKWTNQV